VRLRPESESHGQSDGFVAVEVPTGCSGLILSISGASFLVGLAALVAWQATGDAEWIYQFFRVPAALLMVWLAAVALWLSLSVRLHFAPDELMRRAWTLISLSATAELAGSIGVQILGRRSRVNMLERLPGWSAELGRGIEAAGHLFGGPVRFALLAGGLWYALMAYRKARFPGRLRPLDWLALALFSSAVVRTAGVVVAAVRTGKTVTWVEAANWPTDPLLCWLLALALLLYRSVQQMGGGWIGQCWKAISIGVFLTAAGDVGTLLDAYGYLPSPWSAAVWFVWLPASACFALAPAYQLEAIRNAREGRSAA
jgi:hypothetical protein